MAGCGSDTPAAQPLTAAETAPVVAQYRRVVFANYDAALTGAVAMQGAITAFLASPTPETLAAARTAWIAARDPYGESEAFRFYGGPIDDEENGPEGQLNAWPLDEAYIDGVMGAPTSGIIHNPTDVPMITRAALVALNERGGEENIATGWHAIEFLLWGQDLSATGPGDRPHTDFVLGGAAANSPVARRRQYLTEVTALLLEDLTTLRTAWDPARSDNYGARFVAAAPAVAARRMLRGIGALSGPELAGERIAVAFEERDQEDEHSCFSDNTHNDILRNALGIQNVWLGRFGAEDGPGLDDLVRARDPALADRLTAEIAASVAAARAIPAPFDAAILSPEGSPARQSLTVTIAALRRQADSIVQAASALGLQLTLEI